MISKLVSKLHDLFRPRRPLTERPAALVPLDHESPSPTFERMQGCQSLEYGLRAHIISLYQDHGHIKFQLVQAHTCASPPKKHGNPRAGLAKTIVLLQAAYMGDAACFVGR